MGFVLGSKKGGGLGTRGAKAWVKKEGLSEGVFSLVFSFFTKFFFLSVLEFVILF